MPRIAKAKPAWEIGLQGAVKQNRRGWSVVNFRGKVRLRLQFPKQGGLWPPDQQVILPYPWEAGSLSSVIQAVNAVYPAVMARESTLKIAVDDFLATSNKVADQFVSPWPVIVEAFREHKLNQGNRIKETTYRSSYGRYLENALLHLQGRNPAQTGKELAERVLTHQRSNQKPGVKFGEQLTPWIDMPKSRLECALAIKKFTEYAVEEHRQPQSWLLTPKEYDLLRGDGGHRQDRAVLSDDEVMKVISLLPEHWANVVKIIRVFGFRAWEHKVIKRRINDEGEPQLFVTEGKTHVTRSGVKKKTRPRWLEPIPINGTTFNLVEQWETLKLPLSISSKTLGQALRKLPYWRELMVSYEAEHGEKLVPYCLRHTYSQIGEEAQLPKADLCRAMGHSEEVHNRQYTTSTDRSVRRSFKRAFS